MSIYSTRFPELYRISSSVRHGIQAAVQSYNAQNFVAEIDYDWDSHHARMARYWHNRRYVDNTIYAAVNRYANLFKFQEKLYKHIRGLYNPTSRLIDIEASKVLGGQINYETFEDGAFIIYGAEDNLLNAIRTIAQWSHFEIFKTRLVRDGASMGDVAIKLVDDSERGKVYMETLDPRKIPYVEFDSMGNVKACIIAYEKRDPYTGAYFEYKEEIDQREFVLYANNEEVERYPNPYGFVPLRWVKHRDVGLCFGSTSFHNSRHKIDMINDVMSLLLINLRMQVSTKFAVKKVNVARDASGSPTTMRISTDQDDQAPFIEVGDGEISPIVFPVNVEGALALVADQIREVEADLPQLSLQRMRGEQSNTSGVAIENLYNDAADLLGETQSNYLYGLKAAFQMAISMAAYRGYADFRAYNLNSYEAGALDFDIRPKPLFQDKLSTKDSLELAMQAIKSEGASLLLPKLGFTPEQIAELEAKKDERARQDVRAAFGDLLKLDQEDTAQEMPNGAKMKMNGSEEYA